MHRFESSKLALFPGISCQKTSILTDKPVSFQAVSHAQIRFCSYFWQTATQFPLEEGDFYFQMCWGCDSVPLEFEWHHSHLVRLTEQSEGSAVQINHSRQARLQPEGDLSESLNADILHYSWGRSALLPKQTAALTDKSNVEVYILPWPKVMGFICDNTRSKPRCWTGWTSGVCVRVDYNFS